MTVAPQVVFLTAQYVLAADVRRHIGGERFKRMTRAKDSLEEHLMKVLGREGDHLQEDDQTVLLELQEDQEKGAALVAELIFTPLFAPHDIEVSKREMAMGLSRLLRLVGLKIDTKLPCDLKAQAEQAYRQGQSGLPLRMLGLGIAVATLAIPVVGPLISPYFGAAALTSTLAAVGGTMRGGMFLLSAGGLVGGGMMAGNAIGQALASLGAERLRLELMKLEVTQRLMWSSRSSGGVHATYGGIDARKISGQLKNLLQEHLQVIAREAEISDPDGPLIKDLQAMKKWYELAIGRFEEWAQWSNYSKSA